MHIITLRNNEFDEACIRLAEKINSHQKPDAIIGVKTGGAVVAAKVYKNFLDNGMTLKYYDVSASRNTSKVKKKYRLAYIFHYLPETLLNLLRLVEHYFLKANMRICSNQQRNIKLSDALSGYIKKLNKGYVYIVDDAIDSGATVRNIIAELNRINPNLDYRSAVLVVTQNKPVIFPDIYLYSNVLLRFPWSSDFKS